MKNYSVLVIIAVLVALIYIEFQPKKTIPESSISSVAASDESQRNVDFKAGFAIFTHGTARNFYDIKYHNRAPDVYIQGNNPNIIYVKKSGVIWDDFFKSLPMKVTWDCLTTGMGEKYCNGQGGTLKFYINGKRINNILIKEIKNGDKLLVSYGFETSDQIALQLEQIVSSESL